MILDTILNKRVSLENPKIKISDPRIIEMLDGGGASQSGTRVTRNTAMGLPAYWRGVSLGSRTIGKLPVRVFRRIAHNGRTPDEFHPADWLIRHEPNRDMTPMVFKTTLQAHAYHYGNGFAFIARNERMDPAELIPLSPELTRIERMSGGAYEYVTRTWDNQREFRLAPENVLHIKGLSHDGISGYSVLEILRNAIGLGIALQSYASNFFRNNARPGVVIRLPAGQRITDEAALNRLRDSWGARHGGDNAHKPSILEDGADVSHLSITNEQAQFIESGKANIIDLANVFGFPPHKLGDATRTSYASLEQENQAFLDDAIDPWLVTWEEEFERKLLRLSERQRETRFIEFTRQALVRADLNTRYTAYNTALQGGWMSRDEIRAKENMNPIPNGEGAKFFLPLNVGVVGEEGTEVPVNEEPPADEPATEPPGEDEEEEQEENDDRSLLVADILLRQRKLFDSTVSRFHRRVMESAKRHAKAPRKFNDWLDNHLDTDHREAFCDQLSPVVSTVLMITRGSTGDTTASLVGGFFAQVRSDLNELTGHVTEEHLEERVTLYFNSLPSVVSDFASQLFGDAQCPVSF